jgi:hypothetical protein
MTIEYVVGPEEAGIMVRGAKDCDVVAAAVTDTRFHANSVDQTMDQLGSVLFENKERLNEQEASGFPPTYFGFSDQSTPVVLEAMGFRWRRLEAEGGLENRVAAWRTRRIMHKIVDVAYPTNFRPEYE